MRKMLTALREKPEDYIERVEAEEFTIFMTNICDETVKENHKLFEENQEEFNKLYGKTIGLQAFQSITKYELTHRIAGGTDSPHQILDALFEASDRAMIELGLK